jgi:hypothetical protein
MNRNSTQQNFLTDIAVKNNSQNTILDKKVNCENGNLSLFLNNNRIMEKSCNLLGTESIARENSLSISSHLFKSLLLSLMMVLGVVGSAWGQIATVGTSTSSTAASTTSITLNKPTGVSTGDLMIASFAEYGSSLTNSTNFDPGLSGWTKITSSRLGSINTRRGIVLYKIATSSEPASYTFTQASTASYIVGQITAFSGVNTTTPFDVIPGTITQANASSLSIPGVTTVTAGSAIVALAMEGYYGPTWSGWNSTSPGALTEQIDAQYSGWASVGLAWAIKASAGATGNVSVTASTSSRLGGLVLALRPSVVPTCTSSPSALTSSVTSTTSATLSWTAASPAPASGYEIYYSTSSTAPVAGTAATATTAAGIVTSNITSLSANTTYYWWVRAACSSTDKGSWVSGGNFRTPCDAISTFPWTETFDVTSTTEPCWTVRDGNADGDLWDMNGTTIPRTGQSAQLYTDYNSSNQDYLITPQINLGSTAKQIRFWVRHYANTEPDNLNVKISTTGNTIASFTNNLLTLTTTQITTTYTEYTISLASYSGNVYIAFAREDAPADGWYISIDDVTIELAPSCNSLPSSLTSSVTSSTSATLSWTAASPAPASGYEIYYSTLSTAPTAGTTATTSTAAGVVTSNITSLSANTTYYWWVRSACSSTDKGSWVSGGTFSTREGEACGLAQDLALLSSPFSSTTVGYLNDFTTTSGSCLTGTGGDRIFKIDIPNGGQLFIGQSTNDYDSRHRIAYGGSCPGTTEINTGYVGNLPTQTTTGTTAGCLDDDDLTHYYFNNTTGSTQTVYWIQDGHSSGQGTFTLEWLYIAPPVACSGPTSPGDALTWSPALVTGYNADVIANGVGNASSSAAQFDLGGWALVSADFKATAASAAPTFSLPVSGIVNSAANAGVRYQLASSNSSNSLRLISGNTSGTLTLTNGTTARRIGLLVGSGDGTSTFTAQVNFTDGSNQSFTGNSVADWYGTGYAISGIGRVSVSGNTLEGSVTQPGLYDVILNLSAANYTKTVSSILITKTDAVASALNVMGVSLYSSAAAPSSVVCNGQTRVLSLPDVPIGVTGLTYLWQSSPTGAAPWTSTGVSTTTFTTPSLTTAGSIYYRCLVQCSGANDAYSSVIGFTVNDVASVSAGTLCSGGSTTATALPTSNSTYFWSNSLGTNQTATIPSAGTYTVNVNNNGCISANNVVVAISPDNTSTLSSASGTNNQTVCLNGTLTDITYTTTGATGIGTATGLPSGVNASWNSNTLTISGIVSQFGTYNYAIPLTGGCGNVSASGTITVTDVPTCISSFAPADLATGQNANGINLTWSAVSGANSYDVYLGTNAAATNMVNGVNQSGLSYSTGTLAAATTYYWKIVPRNCSGEAIGCSIYSFETGASCTAPTFTATPTNINCFGGTGSISISASGGVSPYQYSIDNGTNYQLGSSFAGLSAGTYIVTVKGDDACQGATSTVVVTGPSAALNVVASGGGSGCAGTTLSLSSTVTGGTTPYSYLWSNAGGLNDATIASPTATIGTFTSHTLNITDANGCAASSNAVAITNNSPAAPTASNPAAICETQSANLVAISAGNSINWYSAPTGGTALNNTLISSGANYSVTPTSTTTYYAEAVVATSGSQTFDYTGSIVNWTVPSGVTSITINAKGASGGYKSGATAGKGANMTGTFIVTPGQILSILVGQSPGLTTLYPGGGGGTYVALGSNNSTATPLIVAGGGGAANTGTGTNAPITNSGTGTFGGTNGNGATQASCTGGGGGFYTSGANDQIYGFLGGSGFRQGGTGGTATATYMGSYQAGGFGGGSAANYVGSCNTTAGNGGGYSGGGGQGTGTVSVGNAGGSYNGGTSQTNLGGNNVGNGQVTITYSITGCASGTRTPLLELLKAEILHLHYLLMVEDVIL